MKKLVILLAAALTFNSCSDSFLDLSNPSALSPSVYPKSMADMETIVTSVYANMVAVPLYGKRVMAKGTFCVDHTVDMAWTGDANWNQLATNQVTSDNAYIGTLWIGYYKNDFLCEYRIGAIGKNRQGEVYRCGFSKAFADEGRSFVLERLGTPTVSSVFWRGISLQRGGR